jgi:hypothetical protein
MRCRTHEILATVLLLAACATSPAQQEKAKEAGDRKTGEPAAPEKTGLAIGEKAPAFTLKDQTGKERRLDEWLKNGELAIVFHRSAGW